LESPEAAFADDLKSRRGLKSLDGFEYDRDFGWRGDSALRSAELFEVVNPRGLSLDDLKFRSGLDPPAAPTAGRDPKSLRGLESRRGLKSRDGFEVGRPLKARGAVVSLCAANFRVGLASGRGLKSRFGFGWRSASTLRSTKLFEGFSPWGRSVGSNMGFGT
jgi:hypothetical protein